MLWCSHAEESKWKAMKKEQVEGKGDLRVKSLLFKAVMEIKQNDTVPGKTWGSKEWLVYLG